MRKLTFLLAVLTATTTACIATGDDIEVDQPTSAHLAPVSQAVDAQLTDHGRLLLRVGVVGKGAVEGVVLDRGGRVIGELSPGGAVGQLANEIAPELKPLDTRGPVESIDLVAEIAPELLPVDMTGNVESIDLVVETYTTEGVVTRSPITVDLRSIKRAR